MLGTKQQKLSEQECMDWRIINAKLGRINRLYDLKKLGIRQPRYFVEEGDGTTTYYEDKETALEAAGSKIGSSTWSEVLLATNL